MLMKKPSPGLRKFSVRLPIGPFQHMDQAADEIEADSCAHEHRDRADHQPTTQLAEVIDEGHHLFARGGGRGRRRDGLGRRRDGPGGCRRGEDAGDARVTQCVSVGHRKFRGELWLRLDFDGRLGRSNLHRESQLPPERQGPEPTRPGAEATGADATGGQRAGSAAAGSCRRGPPPWTSVDALRNSRMLLPRA